MRRAIAVSLMMLFGLMPMAPLLASDPDANLPACCRKNGKHHCMMQRMAAAQGAHPGFQTVQEKCPCCPFSAGGVHSSTFHPRTGGLFFPEIRRHPVCVPQTQAHYGLSMDRSRQKRGPPFSSLLA